MTIYQNPVFNKIIMSIILITIIWACAGKGNNANADAAAIDGSQVYKKYCVLCHGAEGNLGVNGSKDIRVSALTRDERMELIRHGRNAMTPFSGVLSEEEIKAVADYTMTMKIK